MNALNSMNVQGVVQSRYLGSTIREAKVLKHQLMIPKVPEYTQTQRVSENTPQLQTVYLLTNQKVSEVTLLNIVEENPGQTVAEPTH